MSNTYHQAKIYKITNPHTDKIYIGSTIQRIGSRMSGHRRDYRNYKNGTDRKQTSSCFIFDASDDIHETKIELIKEVKCENKKELYILEMTIINEHDNCVNQYKGQTVLNPNYKNEWAQRPENKKKKKECQAIARENYSDEKKELEKQKSRERYYKQRDSQPDYLKQKALDVKKRRAEAKQKAETEVTDDMSEKEKRKILNAKARAKEDKEKHKEYMRLYHLKRKNRINVKRQ